MAGLFNTQSASGGWFAPPPGIPWPGTDRQPLAEPTAGSINVNNSTIAPRISPRRGPDIGVSAVSKAVEKKSSSKKFIPSGLDLSDKQIKSIMGRTSLKKSEIEAIARAPYSPETEQMLAPPQSKDELSYLPMPDFYTIRIK